MVQIHLGEKKLFKIKKIKMRLAILKTIKLKLNTIEKNKNLNIFLSLYKIPLIEFELKLKDKILKYFLKNFLIDLDLIVYNNQTYKFQIKKLNYSFIFKNLLNVTNTTCILLIFKIIYLQFFLNKKKKIYYKI